MFGSHDQRAIFTHFDDAKTGRTVLSMVRTHAESTSKAACRKHRQIILGNDRVHMNMTRENSGPYG